VAIIGSGFIRDVVMVRFTRKEVAVDKKKNLKK